MPTKKEKQEIMDRHGSVSAKDKYTDEQWSRLMWASHSEVAEIEREISAENAKKGKGLLGMMQASFEEWCKSNEDWLVQYAAETDEPNFNLLDFERRMYKEYLNDKNTI